METLVSASKAGRSERFATAWQLPWAPAGAVALAGALALATLAAFVRHEPVPRGDDEIYQHMAEHPGAAHTFPFAYRVAVPWLVHVLPFSYTTSFNLLAYLCAGGASGFTFLILRRLGLRLPMAASLSILLAVSPPLLLAALRQGRNPDPSTVLVMTAGVWFILDRRLLALAITLLIGAFVRESTLFLAPAAYACWARAPLDAQAARRTVAVAVPMLAAFVGLRLGIPTVGRAQVPGYSGSAIGARFTTLHDGLREGVFKQARRLFTVYGPLWLLAPAALPHSRYARRGLVLLAGSLLSMTFALDWGRMLLLSAPLFYGAAAVTLRRHPRLELPTLVTMLALVVGYAVYMDHSGVVNGIIHNPNPPYPVQ